MHSPVEVTAAGVAELGWGQEGPERVLCGAGCERLELPWEGRAQDFTLLRSREIGWMGNTLPPISLPPPRSTQRAAEGPDAPRWGCTQPFVRGGCYALNFLLFFDLGFYEEP